MKAISLDLFALCDRPTGRQPVSPHKKETVSLPERVILDDDQESKCEDDRIRAIFKTAPTKRGKVLSDRQVGRTRVLTLDPNKLDTPRLEDLLLLFPERFHPQIRIQVSERPEAINILNCCRLGVYDAYIALDRLGIDPFPDFPKESCSGCLHLRSSDVPRGNYCLHSGDPRKLEWLDRCEHHKKR